MTDLHGLVVGLVILAVSMFLAAFALAIVNWFVGSWCRAYTWGLPSDVRHRRIAELRSDLYEHRRSASTEGHRPVEIAFQVFYRFFSGLPGDIQWSIGERLSALHPGSLADAVRRYQREGWEVTELRRASDEDATVEMTVRKRWRTKKVFVHDP